MTNIETLVEDIYGLFSSEEKFHEALFHGFGDNLKDLMTTRFNTERKGGTLRISNIGKPDRQLWYEVNEPDKGEKLTPQTLIKFAYGDVIEQMILLFAKMAGHSVEGEQSEIEINGIKGHLDCIIDGCVVDVKSASSFAFKKFESGSLMEPGNDPFGYIGQLAGYVHSKTPGKDGYFLAVDKQLGKLALLKIPAEVLSLYQVEERISYVKDMVKGPIPERCHSDKEDGKSGNRILGTECSYCSRKFDCWDNLRVYSYSTGPRFFTVVAKPPKVSEFPT